MQDAIIKGTGNSRYLKTVADAPTLYPTYEAFMRAFAAGTLPVDFNGINAAGWTQQGTALNKANLLKDATAALYGLGTGAVPDDVLAAINGLLGGKSMIETGSYVGTGTYGEANPNSLTFGFEPKVVFIACSHNPAVFPYVWGNTYLFAHWRSDTKQNIVTITGTKMSWYYAENSIVDQLNQANTVYNYVAIA